MIIIVFIEQVESLGYLDLHIDYRLEWIYNIVCVVKILEIYFYIKFQC